MSRSKAAKRTTKNKPNFTRREQRGEETLPGSAHSPEAQFISHKTIDKCCRMLYTVNEDADILSHNLHKSTKSIAV